MLDHGSNLLQNYEDAARCAAFQIGRDRYILIDKEQTQDIDTFRKEYPECPYYPSFPAFMQAFQNPPYFFQTDNFAMVKYFQKNLIPFTKGITIKPIDFQKTIIRDIHGVRLSFFLTNPFFFDVVIPTFSDEAFFRDGADAFFVSRNEDLCCMHNIKKDLFWQAGYYIYTRSDLYKLVPDGFPCWIAVLFYEFQEMTKQEFLSWQQRKMAEWGM